MLCRTTESEGMKKTECCLDQMSVPESRGLKNYRNKQQLTHISFVSAAKCNGESKNREILHGSEEDSGQRGIMYTILFQLSIKQAVVFLHSFKDCLKYDSLQYVVFFTH